MRTISLEMIGWNIRVPAESDFAGRNREHHATKIEIKVQRENCSYSIDMMAGLSVKTDVMAVSEDALTYILPETMTKSGSISFQIVGIFPDETKIKSNVIKCKIGPSINAIEAVDPEDATMFEQALAAYAEKLDQAIESAESAKSNAIDAESAASIATRSASAAIISESNARTYADTAGVHSEAAGTYSETSRIYSETAGVYAEKAGIYQASSEHAEMSARMSMETAISNAAAAKRSAEEAKEAARQAQSTEAINNAIKWHNLDKNAHPELRDMIPDLKGYVKYTTQDLVSYYKKSETYTKSEVNALIETVPKFSRKVVDSLPITHISDTTIYLVRSSDPQEKNYFIEYIYVDGSWEIIGGQSLDLDNYATKEWVKNQIGELLTSDVIDSIFN